MRNAALTLALAAFGAHADSAKTATRSVTVLADGIYEIRHPDAPDGFPQGNTTVVIGERRVLVVDSCLLPSSARQDIADIRRWTPLPVSYLVNTHWHFDHTLGNASYAETFPGIQVIAQTETAAMIAAFNPGAVLRYPRRAQRFKDMLASGKDASGAPLSDSLRRDLQTSLAGRVLEEVRHGPDARAGSLAWSISRELAAPDNVTPLAIDGLSRELIAAVARIDGTKDRTPPRWLRRALDLICSRCAETITLRELAHEAGVHPVHFARAFRSHVRCSVGSFVRGLRVSRAAEKLIASDLAIVDIALETGFADQSHFTRVFKRYLGVTPARYRRQRGGLD